MINTMRPVSIDFVVITSYIQLPWEDICRSYKPIRLSTVFPVYDSIQYFTYSIKFILRIELCLIIKMYFVSNYSKNRLLY